MTITGGGRLDIGAFEYAPTPTVTVRAVDTRAAEAGRDQAAFRITRSGDRRTDLRVSYTLHGSAVHGVDYRNTPRRATIKAGSSTCILGVKPTDDHVKEGRETVVIKLLPSGGADPLGQSPPEPRPGLSTTTARRLSENGHFER